MLMCANDQKTKKWFSMKLTSENKFVLMFMYLSQQRCQDRSKLHHDSRRQQKRSLTKAKI